MDGQYQHISHSEEPKHNKYQTQMDYQYAEYIVFIFAHQIERENEDLFRYPFPKCILDVCLLFYFIHFIPLNEEILNKGGPCTTFLKDIELNTDAILPTPFTLLFAIFNKKSLLNMKGWRLMDISEQLKYLEHAKINTDHGRQKIINQLSEKQEFVLEMNIKIQNQMKHVLSMYVQNRLRLLNATNIEEWTDYDILISCIDYFITNPHINATQNESYEKQEKKLKTCWIFISLYRQYIHDTEYGGVTLLEMVQSGALEDYRGRGRFGLQIVKQVCKKTNWKTGQFTRAKKSLSQWVRYIFLRDLDQRTSRDFHFYIYCNGQDIISYETFDKDTILSIFEPISTNNEIDIIGLFSVKRGNKKGISIVLHTEYLEKTVSETNEGVNNSMKNLKGKSYTAICRNVWNRTKDKIYKIDDISADLKRWHKGYTFMFLTDFKEADFDELLP